MINANSRTISGVPENILPMFIPAIDSTYLAFEFDIYSNAGLAESKVVAGVRKIPIVQLIDTAKIDNAMRITINFFNDFFYFAGIG